MSPEIFGLHELGNLASSLKTQDRTMPVLFIGHGSPMNGIEDNRFSREWQRLGKELPRPQAVIVVSAHWLTRGTRITAMDAPRTIYDFGGFPDALYKVSYPAKGSADLAGETRRLVKHTAIAEDHDWGLDHGAWTVLRHLFPEPDFPVLQLSIDYHQSPSWHYALAQELAALRKKGVLIIGSGNLIHNLRLVAWDKLEEPNYGFDWAQEMHGIFKDKIEHGDHRALVDYRELSKAASLAIPTPDHYYPLLYALGAAGAGGEAQVFNHELVGGSLNMTSVRFEG